MDHGLQDMHQDHDSNMNNQQSLKTVPELCRDIPFGNGFPTYFRLTLTSNLNGCLESKEPLDDVVFPHANCTQIQHLERLSRVVSCLAFIQSQQSSPDCQEPANGNTPRYCLAFASNDSLVPLHAGHA